MFPGQCSKFFKTIKYKYIFGFEIIQGTATDQYELQVIKLYIVTLHILYYHKGNVNLRVANEQLSKNWVTIF